VAAVLQALGASPSSPAPSPGEAGLLVLDRARLAGLSSTAGPSRLHCEDGSVLALAAGEAPPPDLPFGYHEWHHLRGGPRGDGRVLRLALSPGTCHPHGPGRAWGWALQLYGLRSHRSWGIGDLGDLADFGRWSNRHGAAFCLINPIHASSPAPPTEASPYAPASRCFRSPLYLRVEDVPGFGDLADDLEPAVRAGRALLSERRIDRDAVLELKVEALGRLWERFSRAGGDRSFTRFRTEQGALLEGWSTYCALSEKHRSPWPTWPEEHRDVRSPALARFRQAHASRVDFFAWLQWLLDEQLATAGDEISFVSDLAVGVGPEAGDAWLWPECFAAGVSAGAPPDDFNRLGQDWGLAPFHPWALRRAGYEPFVRMLRTAFAHAGGLRLDHVMGLFRLFWIPEGGPPEVGTYVRYPTRDLLDLVALESWRAGAWVAGEDLGTVEAGVREELARRLVLTYRLLWFEDELPSRWPAESLAAVGTHDLPTVAGLWTGRDAELQRRVGLAPSDEGMGGMRRRLRAATGVDDHAAVTEVIRATHRALEGAGSALVAASLEDALGLEERPNLPGTVDEHPNWSLALPLALEDLQRHPGVTDVVEVMRPRSGAPSPS
ncbi:MAG: 4-alpha-glucanotransferase, partial [Acidimicrobiales bacterium]